MDTSEYMPMFLAEAREHLQELNIAVVSLEENPEDRPTIDEIFRIAHSFKGMSATMGFAAIADLTHEMEEVFELLRQRTGALSHEAVDTVLACLDALSDAVDGIEDDGTERLDPGPLKERLRALVRSGTEDRRQEERRAKDEAVDAERRSGEDRREAERREPEPEAPPAAPEADLDDEELPAELLAAIPDDGSFMLDVKVKLTEDALMPAVRALMVLTALAEHGELVRSVPDQSEVEGFTGQAIRAWLVTQIGEAEIANRVVTVSDVADVEVTAVVPPTGDTSDAPTPAATATSAQRTEPGPGAESASAPAAATATAKPKAREQGEAPTGGANHQQRTVRVDAERLDALMHSMGELVIHRTTVEALTAGLDVPELQQAVQDLTRSSQALQAMVMQVRMIPVDIVFMRFPRLVRDLSSKLDKEVELQLTGRETELDRTVVDALGDPLVHLVRNAMDHGVEHPDDRVAAGKPRIGTVEIAARHAGGSVVIEVKDDGSGIDPAAVARKAVAKGLIDEDAAAAVDMRGAVELLFSPGFSMAEQASDISGRGVGMDVVRTKIRELGGEVVMDSEPGRGTTAQIRLPLTLAIVAALQVDVAGAPFAIPLDRVERTLRLTPSMVRSVAGRRMLVLEDGVLPLLEASRTFGRPSEQEHELVVIIRGEDRRIGLAVDQLVGQRELVTRPLPSVVSSGEPVSGGAVLADGRISLIVDCDALASLIVSGSAGVSAAAGRGDTPSDNVSRIAA
ncbi:MAG: ATP-binding protein [Solirubrobacteraceae bacterium]